MARSDEKVACDIAIGFYSHLLAGRPVAHALFMARASRSLEDLQLLTPLHFAMAGYPDACITDTPIDGKKL